MIGRYAQLTTPSKEYSRSLSQHAGPNDNGYSSSAMTASVAHAPKSDSFSLRIAKLYPASGRPESVLSWRGTITLRILSDLLPPGSFVCERERDRERIR